MIKPCGRLQVLCSRMSHDVFCPVDGPLQGCVDVIADQVAHCLGVPNVANILASLFRCRVNGLQFSPLSRIHYARAINGFCKNREMQKMQKWMNARKKIAIFAKNARNFGIREILFFTINRIAKNARNAINARNSRIFLHLSHNSWGKIRKATLPNEFTLASGFAC